MKRMGRASKVVLAVTVTLGAPGFGGCMHMAYMGAPVGFDETHSLAETGRDATPSRSNELSPALPSPSEAVEVPPEKTDIVTAGEVVVSVAPSRLKEAPRPRRFLDGR